MVSEYLKRPPRTLCTECKERPALLENGVCGACTTVVCFVCERPLNDHTDRQPCRLGAVLAGLGA